MWERDLFAIVFSGVSFVSEPPGYLPLLPVPLLISREFFLEDVWVLSWLPLCQVPLILKIVSKNPVLSQHLSEKHRQKHPAKVGSRVGAKATVEGGLMVGWWGPPLRTGTMGSPRQQRLYQLTVPERELSG